MKEVIYSLLCIVSFVLSFIGISVEPLDANQFDDYKDTAWVSKETGTEVYIDETSSKITVRFQYNDKVMQGELKAYTEEKELITTYGLWITEEEDELRTSCLSTMTIRMSEQEMIWSEIDGEEGTIFWDLDQVVFKKETLKTGKDTLEMLSEKIQGIDVEIPQFSNMKDAERQQRLNQRIRESVEKGLQKYCEGKDQSEVGFVTIKRYDDKILSFLVEGTCGQPDKASFTNFAFAVNIDLLYEKIFNTRSMLHDEKAFCERLKKGMFHIRTAKGVENTNPELDKYFEEQTIRKLMQSLKDARYYVPDGSVGIILDVPHEAGDYIMVETDAVDIVTVYE